MAERLFSGASPEEVESALAPLVDLQDEGLHIADLNMLVEEHLLPHLLRYDLPACQGLFNSFLERGAAYGAEVALEWNQEVSNWQGSPGGATLEGLCGRPLCRFFGLGEEADATLLLSGGHANQQALYMALHHFAGKRGFDYARDGLAAFQDPSRLAVVASTEAHESVRAALRFLGLGDGSLVQVEVDPSWRLDLAALRQTLTELRSEREVFCVVATAGTRSTGSVDPLAGIADLCHEDGIWLHVDGAYGLAYSLLPEKAALFQGMHRAQTLTWDPHRQLGVPNPSSVLFVGNGELFRTLDSPRDEGSRWEEAGPHPGRKSLSGTRPLLALPLMASLRHQGRNGVVDRLRKPLEAIWGFYQELQAHPDVETLHEPDTGALCFRVVQPVMSEAEMDRLQEHICKTIHRRGRRLISVARLDGRTALRAVAVSPEANKDSLMRTLGEALQIAGAFR